MGDEQRETAETAQVTTEGYARVRCSRCALDQYFPNGPGPAVSSEAIDIAERHAKGHCKPLDHDPTCTFCGESTADASAITNIVVTGQRWGQEHPTALLHVGPTGFVHLHGWHMYPPEEDILRRHAARAVRRRLPSRVLRAERRLVERLATMRERIIPPGNTRGGSDG